MNRNGILAIIDEKGREKERYPVVYGAKILFADGAKVTTNAILLEWDPYTFSILTEVSGKVHFKDLGEGVTLQEQVDEITGMSQWVVTDSPDEKRIPTVIVRPEGGSRSEEKRYLMPTHAHLMVNRRRDGPRRRRNRQDSACDHQDQGHHRRSAARGGTVRSAQAA